MTDIEQNYESVFTVEQGARLIVEILENSDNNGLEGEEVSKAIESVEDLYHSAALLRLWWERKIAFGWDVENQDLIICQSQEENGNGKCVVWGKESRR